MTLQLVLIALCCALEPLPLTAYILTISTTNGVRNGFGFLTGWVLSLVAVIVLTVGVTGGQPPRPHTAPSNAVLALTIVLGAFLLRFAWRVRSRPTAERSDPSWMRRIDRLTPVSAAGLAFLLQPWGLVAGAALTITGADPGKTGDLLGLVAFVVLATATYAGMQAYLLVSPEASRVRLDALLRWIDSHRAQMTMYLAALVGSYLIVRGIVAFAD